MLKYFLNLILLISCSTAVFSQQAFLTGKVTDMQGVPVPFVSVYVNNHSISTIANERGEYRLNLKPGRYLVTFRNVGYKQLELEVLFPDEKQLNVQLQPDIYQLSEVKVVSGTDNRANEIIRRVLAKRKSFLKESSFFSCDVYTKGVQKLIRAPKKFLGEDVAKTLGLDSTGRSILYQSETRSKLYIRGGDKKEIMIASKVAGDNQGFSFNRALDLQVNFYHNLLQWPSLSKQNFVSPVADNAFDYYRFSLAGTSLVDGDTVYKIKVIPRRKFDPVFSGFVYILNGQWRLYSVDLTLTEDARIDFVDTLRISQQFIELTPGNWQPSDITFQFQGKVLGFQFDGYMIGIYSDYQLNPAIPSGFFNNEIMRIDEDVNKKDTVYWKMNRPVPLTKEEASNYRVKERSEAITSSKPYLDSVQRERNKFKPIRYAMTGYRRNNLYNKSYWYFYPFHEAVFYNTVEGWGVNLKARYGKQYTYRRWLEFEPNLRYGFSSKTLNVNGSLTYRYDTLHHASVTVKAGSDFLDLNNRGTLNLFYNTLSTLFEGKNYLKLYQSHFGSLRTQREIVDGLQVTAGVELSRRFPVRNSSYKPIFDKAVGTLTSNNPLLPGVDINLFPVNNAFTFESKASYTYGQRYITRPSGKVYEPARYPTVQLDYRKGVKGVLGSAVDYDFLAMDVFQDRIKMGLAGYSSFYLSYGKFLNDKSVFFPDLHHFTGNQTAVYNPIFPNFHFLDYYAFSTNEEYFEGHYEHNFAGKFISKVPLIRKLKLEEIVGGAYLTQPLRDYKEVYFGLQRLVFRVDYGLSWTTGRSVNHSFRIFYGF